MAVLPSTAILMPLGSEVIPPRFGGPSAPESLVGHFSTTHAPHAASRRGMVSDVGRLPNGSKTRTKCFEFTTRVDGVNEVKPVWYTALGSKQALPLPVNQPTEWTDPPAGAIEFIVFGEGDKRTEVWGPVSIVRNGFMALTGDYPDGQDSVAYDYSLVLTDAIGPVQWSLTGTIPPGLTFDDGQLEGTPTTPGTYRVNVSVIDARDFVKYGTYDITIIA